VLHRSHRILLALLLHLPVVSIAQAAVFVRVATPALTPGAALAQPEPALAAPAPSLLAVDRSALAAFRAGGGGMLAIPTADGGAITLELSRYQLLAGGTPITTSDETGRHPFTPDVSLYRGHVVGEPQSWAVLAMGAAGVFGTLEHDGRRWTIGPSAPVAPDLGTGDLPIHALVPEGARPAERPSFACGIDDANEAQYSTPLPRSVDDAHLKAAGAAPTAAQVAHTTWAIAVDCDYEVYHNKFADNLNAATSYALAVLGAVNSIYERDLSATLVIPYLNFWTTAADPYSAATINSQLTQFSSYWAANNSAISRAAAFLMSGRPLGGGLSIIGGLCSTANGYALAAMDFIYTYPSPSATWDVNVVAHELGHIFGSWHTHSCNWADFGFVPAHTTLDSCFASEGGCATYTDHEPPNKGTIMSYCYLGSSVADGIRLEFHAKCVQRMLAVMAAQACTTQVPAQPPAGPAAAAFGNGVRVTWSASASPGVVGYDVYRSTSPSDPSPEKAGSTATLQFDDASLGLHYYRVRAVRATDASAYSSEVSAAPVCTSSTGAPIAAGPRPLATGTMDANGDGREDLLVLDRGNETLAMFYGQGSGAVGNGTFTPALSLTTFPKPTCIKVADANGDGLADILVGAAGGGFQLRVIKAEGANGVPNGTFMGETGISNLLYPPTAIATGDLNDDGMEDILVAGGNTVLRLLARGANGVADGTYGVAQTTPVAMATQDLLVHDFDGDGVLDLAVSGAQGVKVLKGSGNGGRGDGSFAPATTAYAAGVSPGAIATADLNQDGADDLFVADKADTVVRVFLGHKTSGVPDGTFAAGVKYGAGRQPAAIRVVDWDRNGVPDLLVANDTAPGSLSVLLGRVDGTLANRVALASGGDSTSDVVVTDFDENGALEAVVANRGAGTYERVAGSCAGPLSNTVTLLAPNGGEAWHGLEERTVSWTKGAGVLSVDLQLSLNGGTVWHTIARELTGTSVQWTVPNLASAQCRLRVVVHGMPQSFDASNASFSIAPSTVLGVGGGPGCAGCPGGVALLGAWPNPARSDLVVGFSLPEAATGTLELVDALGRRLAARELSGYAAGAHQVPLLERQAVPPGVYLVRLKVGATLRFAKVTVVR
jgi:hypothetical protein